MSEPPDALMMASQRKEGHMLFDKIKHGDKVTIVTRFGKELTGRAVMRHSIGWVLDMGGTPMIASP